VQCAGARVEWLPSEMLKNMHDRSSVVAPLVVALVSLLPIDKHCCCWRKSVGHVTRELSFKPPTYVCMAHGHFAMWCNVPRHTHRTQIEWLPFEMLNHMHDRSSFVASLVVALVSLLPATCHVATKVHSVTNFTGACKCCKKMGSGVRGGGVRWWGVWGVGCGVWGGGPVRPCGGAWVWGVGGGGVGGGQVGGGGCMCVCTCVCGVWLMVVWFGVVCVLLFVCVFGCECTFGCVV
jgi:hypothetical protein